MRPTFDQTVNVLVQAFLNDELAHKFRSACAVGNIVAAAIGTKPKRTSDPLSSAEFENSEFENNEPTNWYWAIKNLNFSNPDANRQILATGYSVSELNAIECAFESAPGEPDGPGIWRGKQTDPTWMFNGLMAVVDVLAEIHGVDLIAKENAKLQFVKPV